jgi:hypothetical protein
MPYIRIKKLLVVAWLTFLWYLLLGNVHAWEIPPYLRLDGGSRIWFTSIEGDLIQPDRTRVDITDNLGLKQESVVWEYFGSARLYNIHVFRIRLEPWTLYDQAANNSWLRLTDFRIGYDLDFYMSPRTLIGFNVDVDFANVQSTVDNVSVGNTVYTYGESATRVIPSLGLHGIFYPMLQGVAIRPNVYTRLNWWDYESLKSWDWVVGSAVDIPVNELWTWTIKAGYRFWNLKMNRGLDTVDLTRRGFFIESSVMF